MLRKIAGVYITSIVLHYPFAISVGNDENLGVSVWNLLDCSLVRKILSASNLYPVISNKYVFCVTDGPSLFVFSLEDALDKNVRDEDITANVVARNNGKEDQSIHMNLHSILTCDLNPGVPIDDSPYSNYVIKIFDIVI